MTIQERVEEVIRGLLHDFMCDYNTLDGPFNVPHRIKLLATDAGNQLVAEGLLAAEDEQVVWFHGTDAEHAASIEQAGFKEGTWFARHMEDAIGFGGPCVFFVRVQFDKSPLKWQVHASNHIPASAIQRRVNFASQWAPVTPETMPPVGLRVNTWSKACDVRLMFWADGAWWHEGVGIAAFNPSHWQPLPAPPKESK